MHRRELGKCFSEWRIHPDTKSSPESWYEVTRAAVTTCVFCGTQNMEHGTRNTELACSGHIKPYQLCSAVFYGALCVHKCSRHLLEQSWNQCQANMKAERRWNTTEQNTEQRNTERTDRNSRTQDTAVARTAVDPVGVPLCSTGSSGQQ